MKKTLLLLLLAVVAVFSLTRDDGSRFGIPQEAKVVVSVEREITGEDDSSLRVFAADFSWKSDDNGNYILTFTCPCHLGQNMRPNAAVVVEILNQEVVMVKLLPGAVYNIYERRLDNYEKRTYYFPMKIKEK